MTSPVGRGMTVAISSATGGTLPVDPATITGCAGGAALQAAACACSSRRRRSAGPMTPSRACTCGHWSVRMLRKLRVFCQCSACSPPTRSARPSKPRPSVSTWSRNRASSAARRAAWSSRGRASTARPKAPWLQLTISRASSNCRRSGAMAGGRSPIRPSPGVASSPASSRSSASRSPSGSRRGSSSGRPPDARRKASRRPRQARRVGRKTWARESSSGASPQRVSRPAARASRKETSGAMV